MWVCGCVRGWVCGCVGVGVCVHHHHAASPRRGVLASPGTQVRDHLASLAVGTAVRVGAVVGGLAPQKQARILAGA